jgi:hypothetical protein
LGGQSPGLDGIEPSCLQLLREALKLYHTAAVEARLNDKIQMDTTSSTKLLKTFPVEDSVGCEDD